MTRSSSHREVFRADLPDLADGARIYQISLTTWGWTLTGEPAPTGAARRGAKPPVFPVTALDDPALPEVRAEPTARADEMDADTVDRELSLARKAIGCTSGPRSGHGHGSRAWRQRN
ncbi:hypothetical protein ACFC09_17635 [Streptomyces sp. NPDC056161]|uniref:hypothetical protein n=1 Tax=Streptomyces sp. NPDC056161 TaxID=3345732 RepID=UPI0035E23018